MNGEWQNWVARLLKAKPKAKSRAGTARRAPVLRIESLEDRVVPANFTLDATGNNLTISLSINETLTVTDTGANTTFTLNAGNFVQVAGDAPVSNAGPTLVVTDGDIANSLTINNAVAAVNTNNTVNAVVFSGNGTTDNVASDTVSISFVDADAGADADNVQFSGLQLITSLTGTVAISTVNGSIISPGAGTDVNASGLTLLASGLIGASTDPITTTVANLEAAAPGTNGINITNTDSAARPSLTVGGINGGIVGISSGGPVSVVVLNSVGSSNLNVGEAVIAAGNITLSADGSVTLTAPVSTTGAATTIDIVGGANNSTVGDITSTALGPITSAGGAISIGPGGVAGGGAQVVTLGGTVTVNGGLGGILIAAEGNALINAAVAVATPGTGGITVAADNDNNASGDVTTTAAISTQGGSIRIGAILASPAVAQNVTLGAPVTVTGLAGTIGVLADNNVAVNAAVSTTGSGGISMASDIDNSGAGDITTTAAITTAGGLITLGESLAPTTSSQNVTIGAAVTVNGGASGIRITAENTVLVNAAVSVAAGGSGGISITADADNSGAGNITTTATIDTLGGAILIGGTAPAVADTITLGAAVTVTGGAGGITVLSEGTTGINAALEVTGTGGISVTADNNASGTGDIISDAAGTVTTAGGAISLGGTSPNAAVNTTLGGAVTVNGGAGDITVTAKANVAVDAAIAVAMGGTGGISITGDADNAGGGNITTTATISTLGGAILIGGTGIAVAQDVTLGAPVTVAGTGTGGITILADNNAAINGTISVSGGTTGGIIITADADDSGSGDITTTATISMVSTASGNGIVIGGTGTTVAQNVTIGAGVSVNLGTGGIAILAENNVILNSSLSIGAGAGGINVTADNGNSGAGTFTSATAGTLGTLSGNIVVDGGQGILLGGAVSSTGGGNITLTTDGNNIVVNAAVTASGGSGNIVITAEDDVNLNAAVSAAGTGDITITAEPGGGAGSITSIAAGTVTAELGDIILQSADNVTLAGAVAVTAGTGTITVIAEPTVGVSAAAGNFTSTGTGTLTTFGGDISIRAGDSINVGAAVSAGGAGTITINADAAIDNIGTFTNTAAGTLDTAGGNISIRAFDASVGGTISNMGVAGTRVFFLASSPAAVFNIGTNTAFGLTDTELDLVTTETLQIGEVANTGGISLTGTVTIDPMNAPIVTLITDGAVTDGTAGEVADLTALNLAIRAENGIGTGGRLNVGDINIAVSNLAVANTNNGAGTATGNINVFNTGALTIAQNIVGGTPGTGIDGLSGALNTATAGDLTIGTGSPMIVDSVVSDTGGGNITLFTTGTLGDLTVTTNGQVTASGGNGNILIETSASTSGGQITINNGPAGTDIVATGTGNITLDARLGVDFLANVNVQSGNIGIIGGTILVRANVGVPGGGSDITLAANVNVTTRGDVTLNTDPDFTFTGTAQADIVMDPTSIIKGNGNVLGNNLSDEVLLRADGDITVSNVWSNTSLDVIAAENIVDDATTADNTFIQSTVINLTAGGIIGGAVQITPLDVFTGNTAAPSAPYRGAIDFDLDNNGLLTVTSGAVVVLTGTGGNVQLRQVDDPLDPNPEPVRTQDLNVAAASINSDNQLAVISSAGDFLVDSGFVVPSNADVLLATTAGNSIVITGGVTNPGGMNADTVLVASGSLTAGITGTVGGVADVVGPNVNLITTGGDIGTSAGSPLEINATRLDGMTNGGPAALFGGDAFLTDTQNGVAVGRFDAGTGDVSLVSLGNNGVTSNITAVTFNDNVAEIVANVVTLNTTAAGPIAPNNGQIGNGPGQFFEVNANVINAATNNSNLWISEVGTGASVGAAIGSVTAGTGTAFLRVRNGGTITSQVVGGAAEVVAATVNLSTVAGDTPAGGNFGTGTANPLEIDAATLNSNLAGGGNLFVRDTALLGMTVQRATTALGSVGLETTGTLGTMTLGNAVTPAIAAVNAGFSGSVGGAVTLTSSLSIVTGAGNPVADVAGLSLVATAAGGVGTTAAPLETILGTTTTAGLLTVTAGLGQAAVTNNNPGAALAVNNVSASGEVEVRTTNTAAAGENLTVVAGQTVSSVLANVTLQAADNLTVNGTVNALSGVITAAANLSAGANLTVATGASVNASGVVDLDVGTANAGSISLIAGTVAGATGVTATGGTGDDDLTIDFTAGAVLPNGLTYNGGGGSDDLLVTDAGNGTARTYTISGTEVTRSGTTVTIGTSVEDVDVAGGSAGDTFNLSPATGTAFDIHGNNPTVGGIGVGDTLNVTPPPLSQPFLTTSAVGPTAVSGTYTFGAGGFQPVTFDTIENLQAAADVISVTKTDGITNAIPGTTVTYTITVTNGSNVGLTGINFSDTVPAAITGVTWTFTATGTGSTAVHNGAGNTIADTITLAAGGVATYTVTGLLIGTTPPGTGTLVNTASATVPAGLVDNVNNQSATDTDNVTPQVGLSVTKTDGVLTAVPGTSVVYTIVVTNTGPSTVTIPFSDVFPTAITSATRTVGVTGGATGATAGTGNITDTLTLPGGPLGSSVTYTVTAAVDPAATGSLVNVAALGTVPVGYTDTTGAGDNSATDTDTLTPTGDVAVTKTDGVATVTAGTTTTYIITVSNSGPSTVTVPVVDTFPAAITTATRTFTSVGSPTGATAGVGNITDTLTLPPGSSVTYTIVAAINPAAAAGTLINTVTITPPVGLLGNVTANDLATDTDTLLSAPDLAVVANAPVSGIVGTPFSYTFTVTNGGASTQTAVVLTHTLPAEAIGISSSSTQGTTAVAGGVLTATIGTLAPGATATVTVTLNPTDRGAFALTATVGGAIPDANAANNVDTDITLVAPYQPLIVAGPGVGGGSQVRVLNAVTGALEASFVPFGPFFSSSISVTRGDINGDGVPEIIVGAGPGGAPAVKVYDVRTGQELRSFFAYASNVFGGVNVASGDIDGDGRDDIITGAGAGFGPHVKVFSGATGAEIRSFFAYALNFTGGVRVTTGDINGDGRLDIVTGAGGGGSSHVKAFDGVTGAEVRSFFAYDSGLREGVFVATADVDGDGRDEILTGAGGGGSAHIKLFDGISLAERLSFFAFAPTARDGVTVAAGDRNGDGRDEILAGTGLGVQAQVKQFNGITGQEQAAFNAFDIGFIGGVFVG